MNRGEIMSTIDSRNSDNSGNFKVMWDDSGLKIVYDKNSKTIDLLLVDIDLDTVELCNIDDLDYFIKALEIITEHAKNA